MAFEQAAIKVEKEQEFQELKNAIEHALGASEVGQFLKRLESRSIRIRDFDAVLEKGALDQGGGNRSSAKGLYSALSVSDQAQMREFYLSRIEDIEPKLRSRFQKLYRYY